MTQGATADDPNLALENRLREFAALYDNSTTDDDRRYAGYQQLMAIASELQRRGIPGDVLRPTLAIIHGLFDVDKGNTPPNFRPPKKGGGRTIPFDELRQRGLAAAAVTLYMQDRLHSEKAALRKVAHRIVRWPAATQRRAHKRKHTPLWEALKDWRESAMTGSSEDPDASIYALMVKTAKGDGGPPSYWADWALTHGVKLFR